MAKALRLHHDEHFDLLAPQDAPEGVESEGTYTVLGRDGEEPRGKYRVPGPGGVTEVELPDDYDAGDLTAVMHLVQTLQDRHSDVATGVSGTDPMLTSKVAALLGVPVITEETSA